MHLFDAKERPFERIEDSLDEILKQEEVEDLIDHDEYGKIKVAKRNFSLYIRPHLFDPSGCVVHKSQKVRMEQIENETIKVI